MSQKVNKKDIEKTQPATKHAGGRPSSYRPEYPQALLKFFDRKPYENQVVESIHTKGGDTIEKYKEIPCDIPLYAGFAAKIGVHRETLNQWCKDHEEFSDAYKKAKELQENILVVNAMRGNYEQPFSIFTSKNIMEWRDRHEVLEMKFVYTFVSQVTGVLNKMLPDKCPHCKKGLTLREETIKTLEQISQDLDAPKAA